MHAADFGFDVFAEVGWRNGGCPRAQAQDDEAGLPVAFELHVEETPALVQGSCCAMVERRNHGTPTFDGCDGFVRERKDGGDGLVAVFECCGTLLPVGGEIEVGRPGR